MITLYWIWWLFISGLAFAVVQGCLVFTIPPHPEREDGGNQ